MGVPAKDPLLNLAFCGPGYPAPVQPDPVEIRILGCLIEKQRTTPDAYPLTLNALRLACNQTTNRDPVVDYGEAEIRSALERLGRRRWTRNASWSGSRAMKYKHLLDEAIGLSGPQLAVLGVLMLRGPQTPGELKARCERLHRFASLAEVEDALESLIDRELAEQLPRRPGQKEERYEQRLGGEGETEVEAVRAERAPSPDEGGAAGDRLAELERRLGRVEQELTRLREELGA
jgi:uncharacterized protein YceH (UPF0502 family)